jgi:zinc protease
MKRIALALICSLTAGVALAKEEAPLPKELPPYGQDKPLPVPEIAQRTLPNGLTVWVVPREEGIPKVNVVLAVRGGLASDAPEHVGTATLFAGMLNEGTATRSAQQIAEELQAIGGSVGASASADGVSVFGDAFASQSAQLMTVLADVVRNPAFPEKEVALGKDLSLQSLKASESTPNFLAERAMAATLYGSHPYGRPTPTEASIAGVTPAYLRDVHKARFRPDRALLVIAGRIKPADGFALAEKHFGDWKGEGKPPADTPKADPTPQPKLVHVERGGSVQSALRIGRPGVAASSEDAIPLALTNVILGGGFTSRITQNIREDKGYTYSPGSQVARAREGGTLVARAEVRNEVTAAAINEVLYEFDRIGTTLVPDDELARAKRYFAGLYLYQNQLQGAVAGTLAANWLVGLPPEYLGSYVAKAQAVTPEQVREIGRKYYPARLQSIVVVGERAAIAKELAQYGEFAEFQAPKGN